MEEQIKKIKDFVYAHENEIKQLLKDFVNINSVNPRSGGPGEENVASFLVKFLKKNGFDEVKVLEADDKEYGKRPNIIATIKGKKQDKKVWVIAHMDKVPEGDIDLWDTDPFVATELNGKIFGRGSEDNGQSLVSGIYSAITLKSLGITPEYDINITLVSDEETGSDYGIKFLVEKNLFSKDDLIIVPDAGEHDGSFIEIAEKSILWIKIESFGKQAHASRPDFGLNATRIGMLFATELDKYFHTKYDLKDPIFIPDYSTFEPTKKEKNVDNVNTIPGYDVQYFDARILPEYNIIDIKKDIENFADNFMKKHNCKIAVSYEQENQAPKPTPIDSEVVVKLKKAIELTRGIKPKTGGIGGGTCAAILRYKGLPAVVWATIDEMAHQPNEYARVKNLLDDTITFATFYIL